MLASGAHSQKQPFIFNCLSSSMNVNVCNFTQPGKQILISLFFSVSLLGLAESGECVDDGCCSSVAASSLFSPTGYNWLAGWAHGAHSPARSLGLCTLPHISKVTLSPFGTSLLLLSSLGSIYLTWVVGLFLAPSFLVRIPLFWYCWGSKVS